MSKIQVVSRNLDAYVVKYPFVIFCFRNKKKEFSLIERIFPKAKKFIEFESGEIFLGFDESKVQIELFLMALPIVLKWDGALVFSKGEIETKPWKLLDVLACYKSSLKAQKKEKYCQVPLATILAKRSRSIEISIKTKMNFIPDKANVQQAKELKMIPCRMLMYEIIDGTSEEILYLANKTRCSACPRLNI